MLDRLETIFDIEFAPDIDVNFLNFTRLDGRDRFRAEEKTLHLDLEALDQEELSQLRELSPAYFDQEGRVLRNTEQEETSEIESGYDEQKEEIVDYFEPILPERYHSALEQSLYLRGLIERRDLHKEEIFQRKRDIADEYYLSSTYFCSLGTAGYFDRDGGIRNLYMEMGLNEEYDRLNFFSELEDLIEQRLLCVFVESDDEVDEVTKEVRGRLARYQRVDPVHKWVDIRGIGDGCEAIIDSVMVNLEDEFMSIDYDRWGDEQHTVRIHPHSLPPISS